MQNKLEELKDIFLKEISEIKELNLLEDIEKRFLWKKWKLNDILKWLKDLSIEEKKLLWPKANKLKELISENIKNKKIEIEEEAYKNIELEEEIDVSACFPLKWNWHKHPISITSEILEEIFISLWFKIEDWPQIETEEYNFDKLNIPADHPARDVWDTFWINDDLNKGRDPWDSYLLRTHTSPVQIRTMLKWKLPIKIVVPWRVFRYEQEDARHTCNFYQLEWLVVWEDVTFWDLKWTLDTAMKKLLWEETKTRFRPSIFPFTEPSCEVDVSCQLCSWSWKNDKWKCSMCSWSWFVELLWAGMVNPKVLKACNIDPEKYSWFAFGIWIDRIASQRFSISSSRLMYQSKLKLNKQF